jgi:hypothetical protein
MRTLMSRCSVTQNHAGFELFSGSGRGQGKGTVAGSDRYRALAAECVHFASQLSNPADKARMLAMADGWLKFADHTERIRRCYEGMPGYVRDHDSEYSY